MTPVEWLEHGYRLACADGRNSGATIHSRLYSKMFRAPQQQPMLMLKEDLLTGFSKVTYYCCYSHIDDLLKGDMIDYNLTEEDLA